MNRLNRLGTNHSIFLNATRWYQTASIGPSPSGIGSGVGWLLPAALAPAPQRQCPQPLPRRLHGFERGNHVQVYTGAEHAAVVAKGKAQKLKASSGLVHINDACLVSIQRQTEGAESLFGEIHDLGVHAPDHDHPIGFANLKWPSYCGNDNVKLTHPRWAPFECPRLGPIWLSIQTMLPFIAACWKTPPTRAFLVVVFWCS